MNPSAGNALVVGSVFGKILFWVVVVMLVIYIGKRLYKKIKFAIDYEKYKANGSKKKNRRKKE